jgi:hypothetical protein
MRIVKYVSIFLITYFLAALLIVFPSEAELTSEAYEQLQSSAEEALVVTVTKVISTSNVTVEPCYQTFMVDASVLFPMNSTSQLRKGDNITFSSYFYNSTDQRCPTYYGPLIPMLFKPGWCGLVYLNPSENCTTFNIAAYGHSMYDYMSNGTCQITSFSFGDDDNNLDDDAGING